MHLSENDGIEGVQFTATSGQGFAGAALCQELIRRGALEVCSLDLPDSSSWSQQLLDAGFRFFQGNVCHGVLRILKGVNKPRRRLTRCRQDR